MFYINQVCHHINPRKKFVVLEQIIDNGLNLHVPTFFKPLNLLHEPEENLFFLVGTERFKPFKNKLFIFKGLEDAMETKVRQITNDMTSTILVFNKGKGKLSIERCPSKVTATLRINQAEKTLVVIY